MQNLEALKVDLFVVVNGVDFALAVKRDDRQLLPPQKVNAQVLFTEDVVNNEMLILCFKTLDVLRVVGLRLINALLVF